MSQWDSFFTAASYSGAAWGQGDYSDGDLGPEDQILHHLCEQLKADTRLAAIFGERIEVMEARPEHDLREYPRLYLYSGLTTPVEVTGKAHKYEMNIYVGLAHVMQVVSVIERGRPTAATALHWTRHRISQVKNIPIHVAGDAEGAQRTLAELQNVGDYETIRVFDAMERPFAQMQEMRAPYRVLIDHDSGRIRNLTTPS